MKKYLLVSLTVLFAAAFLWADDAVVQLPEPKVDIEGKGTVEWGIDFGSGTGSAEKRSQQHGFKNSASWKVKFPLIKKGDIKSSKADVPVYGEVVLKDVELNIQSKYKKDGDDKKFGFDGKVDNLKAKFVFYGAYLTVYGAPSFKTNYADLWEPIEKEDFDADSHGFKFEPGFKGAGFKLGYANKSLMDLDLGLKFGSNGAWDTEYKYESDFIESKYIDKSTDVPAEQVWISYQSGRVYKKGTSNATAPSGYYAVFKDKNVLPYHSKYGIGFDFAMKPLGDMLGFKLGVNSTFDIARDKSNNPADFNKGYNTGVGSHTSDSVAFSLGAEVTSKPIDGLSLKLGFDGGSKFALNSKTYTGPLALLNGQLGNKDAKPGFAWDLLFNTTYKWVGGGVYVASAGTAYEGFNFSGDDFAKMTDRTADMAVFLKFETKGDKKDDGKLEDSYLVEGLDAGAYLGMYRIFSKSFKDSKTKLPMLFKLWVSYKANLTDSMWIKPFADVWAETNHWGDTTSSTGTTKDPYVGVAYDLGVTYSPVEKVEITAKWAHGKIDKNKYAGGTKGMVIKQNANYNNHNGTFTLGVTVKY